MVWWLAIPAVAYCAKKAYDAFSDEQDEDVAVGFQVKVTSEKSKRTKTRKKAVKDIIKQRRLKLAEALREEMPDGILVLSNEPNFDIRVDFSELNKAISILRSAKADLKNEVFLMANNQSDSTMVSFTNIMEITEKTINNAASSFGEFAGIDADDDYKKSNDPFLKILKSRMKA